MNAQNIVPRLRVGAGAPDGSTGLCGMQVVSWENGDSTITDLPDCADPFLAKVVQRVNDRYCTHRAGSDLLCPPCSLEVLALAHRTVGTALDWPPEKRARVYVEIAVEQAESVLHLTTDGRPRAACALVRRFLAGEAVSASELAAAYAAANAANAYAYAANAANAYANAANANAYAANAANAYANAANAAANAANAAYAANAANAYAANAANAYANAANAAANAANAAYAAYAANAYAANAYAADRLALAHKIIDRFEALTGTKATPVAPAVTEAAVAAMRG
jgi:hypothetical protein